MSYILDALKKSEQERRRGHVPDLGVTQISLDRIRPRQVRWPYFFALGVTLNAGVFLWWGAPWRQEKPSPQPEVRVVERIVTVPAAPQPVYPAPTGGIFPPVSAPISPPAPSLPPRTPRQPNMARLVESSVPPAPPVPSTVVRRRQEATVKETAVAGVETQPVKQQGPPHEVPGGQLPADPTQAALQNALGQYESLLDGGGGDGADHVREEPLLKKKMSDEQDTQGFPDIVDTRHIPSQVDRMQKEELRAALGKMNKQKGGERLDLPDLSQLSPELRKQIPPIAISLHFYSQTSASRKVSINGKMRREGDVLAESLTVDEIVRDGVILRYKDKRFHMAVF